MHLSNYGLFYLTRYPQDELFRLVVDGVLQKKEGGWMEYEKREPGCLQAFFHSLLYAVSDLENTKLTISFILDLHRRCTIGVKKIRPDISGQVRAHPMNDITGLVLLKDSVSEEGLLEIINQIETQTDYPPFLSAWLGPFETIGEMIIEEAIFNESVKKIREKNKITSNAELAKLIFPIAQNDKYSYLPPRPGLVFNKKMNKLIDEYNSNILSAETDEEKLTTIVEIITELERLHPFFDANIRVFAILLLTRLLLQNGFLPATLENPNRFDGYSKRELVNEVKKGMENSLKLINGEKNLFDFNSANLSLDHKKQLNVFTHDLTQYLQEKSAELKLTRGYFYLPQYSLQKNSNHQILLFNPAKNKMPRSCYLKHNNTVMIMDTDTRSSLKSICG